LEALYIVFRIIPFSSNIARSLVKEPKIYFYDTGMVISDNGAKFENVVTVSLLRHVYSLRDYKGINASLQYVRTRDKKEIDFCIARDGGIEFLVEAKKGHADVSAALKYFHEKYDLKAFQVVQNLKRERMEGRIAVRNAVQFLKGLSV